MDNRDDSETLLEELSNDEARLVYDPAQALHADDIAILCLKLIDNGALKASASVTIALPSGSIHFPNLLLVHKGLGSPCGVVMVSKPDLQTPAGAEALANLNGLSADVRALIANRVFAACAKARYERDVALAQHQPQKPSQKHQGRRRY